MSRENVRFDIEISQNLQTLNDEFSFLFFLLFPFPTFAPDSFLISLLTVSSEWVNLRILQLNVSLNSRPEQKAADRDKKKFNKKN